LKLFLAKCEREQITSFADYDEKYMVHYRSDKWVEALIDLTEDERLTKIITIREKALNIFENFGGVLPMKRIEENAEREERIEDEIVVDTYNEYERITGWYCYLDAKITFPFKAKVIKASVISPLKEGEETLVLGMADQEQCDDNMNMFVEIEWKERKFSVPLEQLYPVDIGDEDTVEAIEDWHYWVDRGYRF